MVRQLMTAILTAVCLSPAADTTTALDESGITFTAEALEVGEHIGGTDITVAGDTVTFTLYYVDTECGPCVYRFEHEGKDLRVMRALDEGGGCDTEAEIVYAVKGMLIGVPKGAWNFKLMGVYEDSEDMLYGEMVKVR